MREVVCEVCGTPVSAMLPVPICTRCGRKICSELDLERHVYREAQEKAEPTLTPATAGA